jgi:hypothetical protein
MKLYKNQVVRITKYKGKPAGWHENMLVYMGNVVVIDIVDSADISQTYPAYRIRLKDIFHTADILSWHWRRSDFEKVNTIII